MVLSKLKFSFWILPDFCFVLEVVLFVANELLYGKDTWNSSDDAF